MWEAASILILIIFIRIQIHYWLLSGFHRLSECHQCLSNIGKQVNKGVSGTIRYAIIYRPQERINWTMSLSFRNVKTYYDKIGRKLNQYNKQNISKNLTRYYDGGSPTALWAVRSAGIDPATGQEIFLTKDGKPTFQHNYDNEVVVGNTNPDVASCVILYIGRVFL